MFKGCALSAKTLKTIKYFTNNLPNQKQEQKQEDVENIKLGFLRHSIGLGEWALQMFKSVLFTFQMLKYSKAGLFTENQILVDCDEAFQIIRYLLSLCWGEIL